jgi:hypothetical protein
MILAEPGWAIPAGKNERRYAVFEVDQRYMQKKEYFEPLNEQIERGGAEAMFWDLQRFDLGGWHPREIPQALLHGAGLRRQQRYALPALDQWYLGLLKEGRLPGASAKTPSTAGSTKLVEDAKEKFPRLKLQGLSYNELQEFLEDPRRIGVVCEKKRTAAINGWIFPPLAECRAGWEGLHGPVEWDPVEEWFVLWGADGKPMWL